MPKSRFFAGLAVCTAPLVLASSPAMAQDASEEILVTGELGDVPDSVQSLSQSVSYADLNLGTDEGMDMLRKRISLTARFLCDKLGESNTSSPLIPSCRQAAVDDAMDRVGTMKEAMAPRGTTWVPGPAWQAPYPADWATRYP